LKLETKKFTEFSMGVLQDKAIKNANAAVIAVEVCNWGSLTFKDGKYYSWANAVVPAEKAIELNYKYVKFYEAYTDAEIKALKYWTLLNALRLVFESLAFMNVCYFPSLLDAIIDSPRVIQLKKQINN
jgi:hypothetical protein